MAFPLRNSSFLLPLLIVITFTTAPSSGNPDLKVSNSTIKAVCSKTLNPPFCLDLLHFYADHPHERSLKDLARITICLAHSNATATRDLLHRLIQHTDNPRLKERYTSCSKNYDDSVGDMEQAKKSLKSSNKNGLRDAVAGAMGEVNACGESFGQPPADPSTLPKSNQKLLHLCSIILVMSKFLL
jgi:pectinesterase inhibitor-like protein